MPETTAHRVTGRCQFLIGSPTTLWQAVSPTLCQSELSNLVPALESQSTPPVDPNKTICPQSYCLCLCPFLASPRGPWGRPCIDSASRSSEQQASLRQFPCHLAESGLTIQHPDSTEQTWILRATTTVQEGRLFPACLSVTCWSLSIFRRQLVDGGKRIKKAHHFQPP